MARPKSPYTYKKRIDTKCYQFTLNPSCGLPEKTCKKWQRKSFLKLPDELAIYRNPKREADVKIALGALIDYLKKQEEEKKRLNAPNEDITVGDWVEKFTIIETSPRTAINNSKNRPPSIDTFETYKSYFKRIKDDPIVTLKMSELEEDDITFFSTRLALQKKKDGSLIGGTRTHAGIIKFLRTAFKNYQRKFPRWFNPFTALDAPLVNYGVRDSLPEDEVMKLFQPGVLKTTMELAVCACIFLSGLRRGEVAALKPEDLNWSVHTPKIVVRRAWQAYGKKKRVLGPPKGKKHRNAPFDPILQEAIKKLWQENEERIDLLEKKAKRSENEQTELDNLKKREWVFTVNGRFMNSQWTQHRFPRWLKDAGIELNGREIVPHSARHSLASILEERGTPMRHIQELLGHSDLVTTKIYLHSTEKTIREIGKKITEAREGIADPPKEEESKGEIIPFTKVS